MSVPVTHDELLVVNVDSEFVVVVRDDPSVFEYVESVFFEYVDSVFWLASSSQLRDVILPPF